MCRGLETHSPLPSADTRRRAAGWQERDRHPMGQRPAAASGSSVSLPRARPGAEGSPAPPSPGDPGLEPRPGLSDGLEAGPEARAVHGQGAPGPASLHPALHGMGGAERKQTAASGTTSGKAAARGHSPPRPAHGAMLAGSSAGAHAQAHTVHAGAHGPHPDRGPPGPRGRHRHSWSWAGVARKHQWFLQRFPFLSFCFHFSSDVVFFF